ncbi:MAG: non-homologous end-joining DNA ligase [Thermoleophilaceae bacterium]
MKARVRAGRRTIEVSSPDKVLFPEAGVTKEELARYYARVARWMLPHVRGRPVSMQRFPDGVGGKGFFHKDVPDYFPDWIERAELPKRDGTVTHPVIDDAATLVYLAQQNTITPHVWQSRADDPSRPDRIVFDLDPSKEDFGAVREGARLTGELLDELGLAHFAMTTGSRGVHVTVPIRRGEDFGEVREFTRAVAALLAGRHPDLLTAHFRKAKRGGRILVDEARNRWAQTAVPPYAVRARPDAPVAVPLEWKELSDSRLRPDRWTVRDVFRRLERKGDPWSGIGRSARGLGPASRRLAALVD